MVWDDPIVEVVRAAATRGARAVTRRRQVVDDAITFTVEAYVDATIADAEVRDVVAWSRRVAANAARRMGRRCASAAIGLDAALASAVPDPAAARPGLPRLGSAELRMLVDAVGCRLRGRQAEVVGKLCEPGMTFGRAARELAMDARNLRRSFRSALVRIRARK